MKPHHRDFTIAGVWFVVDQATKLAASLLLGRADGQSVLLIPNTLRFTLSHNRGALFGLGNDLPDPWRMILLTGFPLLALVAIAIFLGRVPLHERFARLGLALILGGAAGNVLDRIIFGHVVDFIDVYAGWQPAMGQLIEWFGTNRWPTFNIADIGLVTGACLLLLEVFFGRAAAEPGEAAAASSSAEGAAARDEA